MESCDICGSTRVLEGPAYDPTAYTCLDCGSQFGRTEMRVPDSEEVRSQISTQVPIPAEGFSSPEAAAAHLAKLKEAAKKLGKATEEKVDRPSKPKVARPPSVATELKDGFPKELVMMGIHVYTRKDESWNQALATAKGEREFRAEGIRVWAHNHEFGKECANTCKEI